ncbi:hypothetical protein SAMN02745751_02520 [Dethiosulfatibacter aminovorans DSM 17477]|uniref:Uncharacterized protein n=1 Tax=Dethiosulfatibacter aminovorans DSM 17477 TaxID=1121476 RepID=A0A1M6J6I0_9FIRM|nr:hypothetical protein [Dethiosulfatibacter aminovorans]SHJ42269.1 hypothetical protein SAMN02745751_02520 [Dethiosulfatibacter aminovorans DSM 17477]
MNLEKLKEAEEIFFSRYPKGFEEEEMKKIAEKHKISKMKDMAREMFAEDRFLDIDAVMEDLIKIVSRSSLVSVFEKARFKDYGKALQEPDKSQLVEGLYETIHGDMEKGFDLMIDVLEKAKLAKWPIITICPLYYNPDEEVFIKPTTVKKIIAYYELEDIIYKPRPSYEFYSKYKKYFKEMRREVDIKAGCDNASFSGFLMMSVE